MRHRFTSTRVLMSTLALVGMVALHQGPASAEIDLDGLSDNPKQFRAQVEQLVASADAMMTKLQNKTEHEALVLDLQQTRDDILRELPKVESKPGEAQWTTEEMVESVKSKLRLLKDQYEKASEAEG